MKNGCTLANVANMNLNTARGAKAHPRSFTATGNGGGGETCTTPLHLLVLLFWWVALIIFISSGS